MVVSNLNQLLTDKQLSLLQVSVITGITPSTLYRLRDTKNIKNINVLVTSKVCKALNCSFEELYTIK
jgi:DNA-binding Xre family transcriptional regulator